MYSYKIEHKDFKIWNKFCPYWKKKKVTGSKRGVGKAEQRMVNRTEGKKGGGGRHQTGKGKESCSPGPGPRLTNHRGIFNEASVSLSDRKGLKKENIR
jgi:hypothetical protein